MSTRTIAVAVVLAFCALGLVSTASAHNGGPATPANSYLGGHWWSYDGCSFSPDWPFLHACIHHDGCYAHHWANRFTCDVWFLNDMRASCAAVPLNWGERAVCYSVAVGYFYAVRRLGEGAYIARSPTVRIA